MWQMCSVFIVFFNLARINRCSVREIIFFYVYCKNISSRSSWLCTDYSKEPLWLSSTRCIHPVIYSAQGYQDSLAPCQMLWPTLLVCFGRISQTPLASANNDAASLSRRSASLFFVVRLLKSYVCSIFSGVHPVSILVHEAVAANSFTARSLLSLGSTPNFTQQSHGYWPSNPSLVSFFVTHLLLQYVPIIIPVLGTRIMHSGIFFNTPCSKQGIFYCKVWKLNR